MDIQNLSPSALRRRRRNLVRGLPPLEKVLRGPLTETYKRCGGPNCHCVDGPGHGPKRYLVISQPGGRPRRDYVPNAVCEQVVQLIDNFHRLREALNEIPVSTTLAEIFTGLCRAKPFAAVRTAPKPRASDVSDDKMTHGG
jgi:hypothetical protein